jgi:hypothetical protein
MKLRTGDLDRLFSSCECYENQYSEIHTVLTDLNEMMPLFLAYSIHFGEKKNSVLSGAIYGESVSFVNIGTVKAVLCLMLLMNFCPKLTNLFSSFGEF